MTRHDPALAFSRKIVAKALLSNIIAAAEGDRIAAIAACDAALDILAPSMPDAAPGFTSHRDDCVWWVEFAPDSARAEMLAALLRHVNEIPINSATARKRAMVAIWNTLNQEDRTAFLERVDPGPGAKA